MLKNLVQIGRILAKDGSLWPAPQPENGGLLEIIMKCKDCKFWDDSKGDTYNDAGYCRRESPKLTWSMVALPNTQFMADAIANEFETAAIWPETDPTDWCGEFQQKTKVTKEDSQG